MAVTGKVRREGFDLEINGLRATGWELGAGHTFAYYGGSFYGEPRKAMMTVRWSL